MDRVEQSPHRVQLKHALDHSLDVNKTRISKNDLIEWYCKLRQGKEFDHEYDGVCTKVLRDVSRK